MPAQRDPIPRHRDPLIVSCFAEVGRILVAIDPKFLSIDGQGYSCFSDSQDRRPAYDDQGGSVDAATTNLIVPEVDLRDKFHAEVIFEDNSYRIGEISYDGANSSISLITDSAQ